MFGRHDERIDELSQVPLFGDCRRNELEVIASVVDEATIPAGRVLMREGRMGREAFVLLEGEADVEIGGERIAHIGPGDITGEMALIEHQPRTATVITRTPVRALVLTQQSLDVVLDASAAITLRVMRTLSERLREVQSAA